MTRKIPCFCDNTFSVEVPEQINLDADPHFLQEIQDGSFMNYTCTSCGKVHKPEFPITILWPSKNAFLEIIPEIERLAFYRRKPEKRQKGGRPTNSTLIGYPEMAERLLVIQDDLEPMAVEALKYYLMLKAQENSPEGEISVWYRSMKEGALEFHIQGLKEGSIAVMKIPLALYTKTLQDYTREPKGELYTSLRFENYCSIQNMMRPTELL